MSAQDNATTLGKPNQNLVLETAGRIYVKVQDRFYELDFRNQGRGAGDTKIEIVNNNTTNQDIDLKGYVTKEFLKASLNSYVTKRSWNDVKETQSMLENAMLDGFTESINPITIQTMQVVVGADQLQFEFVDSFIDDNISGYGPTIHKNSIEFEDPGTGIYIKHYTLDGPTDVRPESLENSDELLKQYCRWKIAPNYFDLGDPEASYYIYIKVPKLNWTTNSSGELVNSNTGQTGVLAKTNYTWSGYDGEFVLSNTAIEMTTSDTSSDDYGYYYLLYGMINSDDGTGRSFSTMNGFTEILPGQITAYIFKSASGDSYLDLRQNVLKLGDAFMWNIDKNGHIGDQILYIKGGIVVDDGGNESPMQLDRGMFHRFRYQTEQNGTFYEHDFCNPTGAYHVEGNIYYPGNIVTWTNDKGITSSYIYIGPAPEETNGVINPRAYFSCNYDPEVIEEEVGYDESATYYNPENENFWRVFAKGVRGYSNLIADLTNEMEAIACDKDGYVITDDGLDVITQIGLYYGASDVEIANIQNTQNPNITIDLSEITNLNPQPEDPLDPPNPTISYEIDDIENSYEKLITFHIDHNVLLPEKAEIPITIVSKDKFGEDQDDTRTIVFTLVGVRSGKAYALVPSARSIRLAANGLYDPSIFECDVICNGSSENVDVTEVLVKRVYGDTVTIHTESNPNGLEIPISTISSHLNDFINEHSNINGYSLDWDWYTDENDHQKDYIVFDDSTDFEKITLFLYYKDPLSYNWILCDKETILVVKDGDPGKDFSISASSNVFMYETETSKVPTNSSIILKGVPKNIKSVSHYIWQYKLENSNSWNYIDPPALLSFNDPTNKPHWWKVDSSSSQSYVEDSLLRSTLVVNGPIEETNNSVSSINYRDFNTYFKDPNDNTPEYRVCEFQVTIYYDELGTSTSLTDSTSLVILKGGDGTVTVLLPNSSMIFASTEKGGVSLNSAEQTPVEVWYGIEEMFVEGNATTNAIDTTRSLINIDITRYKYKYKDTGGVEQESPDYIGTGNIHTYEDSGNVVHTYESIPNVVKAHLDIQEISNKKRSFIVVETGTSSSGNPFNATSGEIDVTITVKFPDKITESVTVVRTIYWHTAQQGEPGAGKQLRGRSEWGGQYGYCDMENCRTNGYYPTNTYRMDYQGLYDEESNWVSAFSHNWDDNTNIFFDIILYPVNELTYYCKHGGASALWGDPESSYYISHVGNFSYVLPPNENTYAWAMMQHINIASDVAYIRQALIDELQVKKLYTPGVPGIYPSNGNAYIYVKQLSIANNALSITNARNDVVINVSSENLPSETVHTADSGTFSVNTINCDSSGVDTKTILSKYTAYAGKVSISPFTININYSSLGSSMIEGLNIKLQVWLTTNSSGNSGTCLGTFNDTSVVTNHSFNVDGGLYDVSSGTFYIVANLTYSICNGYRPTFQCTEGAYGITYPSSGNDGTIIAGDGFQTKWGNNKFKINSSDGINLRGTVELSGTIDIIRNNSTFSAVGGSNVNTIYVQQGDGNTTLTADGLYFLYS